MDGEKAICQFFESEKAFSRRGKKRKKKTIKGSIKIVG
jgi:hypothetical protein